MAELDLELIRHALTVARKNGFAEVELALGADVFAATLAPLPPGQTLPSLTDHQADTEPQAIEVKALLVGYYRPAKSPLKVGANVKQGDIVAVIAALGIANDVEAPASGEVVEVLISDGDAVQYGQVIARIRP